MKKICILCLIVFMVNLAFAAKLGNLKDVFRPIMIEVSDNNLYILEGATISSFSLKDLSLLKKVGREGEGPGELKNFPFYTNDIKIFPDFIYAEGFDKFLYFSKDGKLLNETKKNPNFNQMLPIGKNFVVTKFDVGKDEVQYAAIYIHNPETKIMKELYKQEALVQKKTSSLIPDILNFSVYDNKLFVEESPNGFVIEVFNSSGEKLYKIERKYKKIEVTDAQKNDALNSFKEDPFVKERFEMLKQMTKFTYPDYFPAIQDIEVKDKKIYVRTFNKENKKEEYVIMDLDGKNAKSVFIPIVTETSFKDRTAGRGIKFYSISNGKLYYLKENMDDEVWELHAEEIK